MAATALRDTARILGLKRSLRTTLELMPVIRRGLSPSALEHVGKELEMSAQATAESLGLATRTIARRLKDRTPLSIEESERVVRLARVLARATEVLGTREKARRWLLSASRALGGEVPIGMLDTDIGANAVLEELGRIDYGVFA